MKKLQFSNLVAILQNSFDEDLFDYLNDDCDDLIAEPVTENPLAGYLLVKLLDSYDDSADNTDKIDTFFSVIEDVRFTLQEVENSLDSWQDIIDDGESYSD